MIKYKNDDGEEITQDQAEQSGDYDKEFYVNNSLKYIYTGFTLRFINYFISPSETETNIVNQFSNLGVIINITYTSMYGVFKEEYNKEYYSNGNLRTEGKSLIAPDGQTICNLYIWDDSNANPPNTVSKQIFVNEVEYFEFGYHSDGSFIGYGYTNYSNSWLDNDEDGISFDSVGMHAFLPLPNVPIDSEYFRTDVFDPTPFLIP